MNYHATENAKRALRTEIARSRRRLDRRLHAMQNRAGELTSWRTYVARYPAATLGLGLLAGWLLSGRQRASGLARWALKQGMASATGGPLSGGRWVMELLGLLQTIGRR